MRQGLLSHRFSRKLHAFFLPFFAFFFLAVPIICNCPSLADHHQHAQAENHDCHHEESGGSENQSHHDHNACFCAHVPAMGVNEAVSLNTSPLSLIAVLEPVDQYELRPIVIDYTPYYHSPPSQRLALYLRKSSFLI